MLLGIYYLEEVQRNGAHTQIDGGGGGGDTKYCKHASS